MEQNKTAMQWLIEIYETQKGQILNSQFEQAKQMEKEQIIHAFIVAEDNQWDGTRHGVHYYLKKYGKTDKSI